MQLNITTDYAIRTILYLGRSDKKTPAKAIAKEMKIPEGYMGKVLSKLKEAQIIDAELGAHGGYWLKRSLDEITIGDVIRTMEMTVKINRCLEPDNYCNRGYENAKNCKVRKYYFKIQNLLEMTVFNVSLQDILDEKYSF